MTQPAVTRDCGPDIVDAVDRRIIAATQRGLPLCARPFDAVAAEIGLATEEVLDRMRRMLATGVIRRVGIVPNHYALGYRFNGMSVWDVDDRALPALGRRVGALDFVTHCYRRPRRLPVWRYNLFAMVHGRTRGDVEDKVARIQTLLGAAARAHDVLYSRKILKKTGLRVRG